MIGRMTLLFTGTLLLAACAGAPAGTFSGTRGARISPFYAPALVSYVARNGTFPVVVRGNPFGGVPQAQLEQALHQRMRLPGWAPNARFTADPAAEAGTGLRLVVLFNPAGTVGLRAVCGDLSGMAYTGPANQMTMRVGFCDGPQSMSDVTLRTAPPPDETSAAFIGALNNAAAAALPFIDRNTGQ